MITLRYSSSIANEHTETIDHGVKDQRGRDLGAVVWTAMVTFKQAFPAERSNTTTEPGTYFAARVQNTRNGEPFGPGQPTEYFTSESARRSYIERRVADSARTAKRRFQNHK